MEREGLRKIVSDIQKEYSQWVAAGNSKQDAYIAAYSQVSKGLKPKLTKEEADYVIKKLTELREAVYSEE